MQSEGKNTEYCETRETRTNSDCERNTTEDGKTRDTKVSKHLTRLKIGNNVRQHGDKAKQNTRGKYTHRATKGKPKI